jgi:hypothetical protein
MSGPSLPNGSRQKNSVLIAGMLLGLSLGTASAVPEFFPANPGAMRGICWHRSNGGAGLVLAQQHRLSLAPHPAASCIS